VKVAIAGARGFIGKELMRRLEADRRVEAVFPISRSPKGGARVADLADLNQSRTAVAGATHAIYLVHSMSPQAKLAQGRFADFDLQQADNFARACRDEGVSKIIYLGGLLPGDPEEAKRWSDHLQSRLEVERVLGAYGAQVTALRAGLILGVGGSSSEMLIRLVRRLPFMIAPRWTQTLSEPLDVADAAEAIHRVLFREDLQGQDWDLSSGERLRYVELMARAAKVLGLKRLIIPVPILTPGASKLWVSLVTGAPRALVYPLIRSLRHEMLSRPDRRLLPTLGMTPVGIDASLARIMDSPEPIDAVPSAFTRYPNFKARPTVRSIQRFSHLNPAFLSSITPISTAYFTWLPRLLLGILFVKKRENAKSIKITFEIRGTGWRLLELESEKVDGVPTERFRIVGGLLQKSGSGGFLEFRAFPGENCALAIVQDFVPRLPWPIYRFTQALIHLWVMRRFGAELVKQELRTF
jgi:nucleoside-diphosphate-sugar epimerase